MRKNEKAVVASGHELVSKTGASILSEGGNVFDAITGAGFVSAVVEPALTSLGGGGFMVCHDRVKSEDVFYDFFVDTPGIGRKIQGNVGDFFPVTVTFSGSSQDFNVGKGAVAVPGTLKGLLEIHGDRGIMPLREVLSYAKKYASSHQLNRQQAHFLDLLYPIMNLSLEGKKIYLPEGQIVQEGDTIHNRDLVNFIDHIIVDGDEEFYRGEIAQKIANNMKVDECLLSYEDLAGYKVKKRKPFKLSLPGYDFVTAGSPSVGGALIGLSLGLSWKTIVEDNCDQNMIEFGSYEHLCHEANVMKTVELLRKKKIDTPEKVQNYLKKYKLIQENNDNRRLFSRGTTHISISDGEGNCASMTCSNGEGSGYFAPGTGVMLNNMMGEDDLHPDGFHATPSGERVCSMMSPSLMKKNGKPVLIVGSGGSKRIRTAISQVILRVIGFGQSIDEAVNGPRLHFDRDVLHVEPGFSAEVVEKAAANMNVNLWPKKDVFFGGVHCVAPFTGGAGDPRRGGAVAVVDNRKQCK